MKINSFKKSKKSLLYKITLLVLAHVGAFVLGVAGVSAYSTGPKWAGESVKYYVNSTYTSTSIGFIKTADAAWDGAGSTFRFKYQGTTSRNPNTVSSSYKTDDYNDIGWAYNGSTGALATTKINYDSDPHLYEVDTTVNISHNWSSASSCPSDEYDLQNAITHEFGHWLVLYDRYSTSSPTYCGTSSEATMCGSASTGETRKRSLASDDKNGIIAIYGK